jgi:hypothetical protein
MRLRVSIAIAALAAGFVLHGATSSASTVPVTLPSIAPVADTYVDANTPNRRYGTTTTLSVRSVPVRRSYLRFQVSGVAGPVTNATLILQPTSASTSGIDVRSVASTTWSESATNYKNAPAVGGLAASSGAFPAGTVRINVTPLIQGNGLVSMALTTAGSALVMPSREAGANGPRLEVTYTRTVTPAVTLTAPANGSSTSDSTPTFSGAAGNAPGDSPTVTLRVYSGTSASGTPVQTRSATRSGASWAIDAQPALADGVYTAQATQPDSAGDVGTSSPSTFTVDTVAPQPSLSQPAPGSTVTTSRPTFSGSAGSAAGDSTTVTVEVYAGSTVSGSPEMTLQATRSGVAWSVTPTTDLGNGTHTARARQSDAAGNSASSAPVTFTVDATGPPPSAYRDTVVADTPRGYWRLGESGGTVAADEIGTSAGAYTGGVTLAQQGAITGDANTAARLDGVNDTVRIPNATALNSASALSLEAFVRPGTLPGSTATIMRKDLQYLVRITSGGNVIFRLWKGGENELSTAAGVLVPNRWSHVVATYDGATMRVYVNGVLRGSRTLAAPVDTRTSDLYLGASINYDWLAAHLDEVAVYTRALSATDVQRHFNAAGIVDQSPSNVKLETPENGATWDATVAYGGSAGTDAGDDPAATIKVYSGTSATGTPVRTVSAPIRIAGTFSAIDSTPLASGTYTAQAEQRDGAGNVGRSQPSTFTVQAGGDPHVLAAGDIAACDTTGDEATAEVLDRLFGTVIPVGDLAYEAPTAADYDNCYDPTWGRQRARSRPIPGDHDYSDGATNAQAYFAYFGALAGDPSKGYYSYNLGSWHIIALNSMCSKVGGCDDGDPQEQWLQADLASNVAVCTMAVIHEPRFSSGTIHGNNAEMQAFWQTLYDHNADLVLSASEHVYERFGPQTPTGAADAARGIRQITVGTGGRSHYGFRSQPVANSQVRNNDAFGILDVTLKNGAYDWRFVPEAGKTFTDTGTAACH